MYAHHMARRAASSQPTRSEPAGTTAARRPAPTASPSRVPRRPEERTPRPSSEAYLQAELQRAAREAIAKQRQEAIEKARQEAIAKARQDALAKARQEAIDKARQEEATANRKGQEAAAAAATPENTADSRTNEQRGSGVAQEATSSPQSETSSSKPADGCQNIKQATASSPAAKETMQSTNQPAQQSTEGLRIVVLSGIPRGTTELEVISALDMLTPGRVAQFGPSSDRSMWLFEFFTSAEASALVTLAREKKVIIKGKVIQAKLRHTSLEPPPCESLAPGYPSASRVITIACVKATDTLYLSEAYLRHLLRSKGIKQPILYTSTMQGLSVNLYFSSWRGGAQAAKRCFQSHFQDPDIDIYFTTDPLQPRPWTALVRTVLSWSDYAATHPFSSIHANALYWFWVTAIVFNFGTWGIEWGMEYVGN